MSFSFSFMFQCKVSLASRHPRYACSWLRRCCNDFYRPCRPDRRDMDVETALTWDGKRIAEEAEDERRRAFRDKRQSYINTKQTATTNRRGCAIRFINCCRDETAQSRDFYVAAPPLVRAENRTRTYIYIYIDLLVVVLEGISTNT